MVPRASIDNTNRSISTLVLLFVALAALALVIALPSAKSIDDAKVEDTRMSEIVRVIDEYQRNADIHKVSWDTQTKVRQSELAINEILNGLSTITNVSLHDVEVFKPHLLQFRDELSLISSQLIDDETKYRLENAIREYDIAILTFTTKYNH